MRKLEKKRDYIAYFQYSPEIYGEVRRYIPAQMRSQIDRELAPWIENIRQPLLPKLAQWFVVDG